jgi:hypothetical protein
MGSWRQAGRILQGLRESRAWEVPRLAAELTAQATAIGQAVPSRQSLVRMIYEWEAGTHRPRAYYVLFVLVYATEEELAARTIQRGSELDRLMAALKAMGVPVNRRQFLLNAAALAGGVAGVPAVAANLEGQERFAWVLKHPRNVDLPTVRYLRAQALDLIRQNEAVASSTSLQPQAAQRLEQVTLLREHAPLGRVRQELYTVEAQAATLLGRLVWDVSGQRDHATAARHYDQAITAASNVKEGWAEAFPRMFQRFNPVSAGSMDLWRGWRLPSGQALVRRMAQATSLPAGRWPSWRKPMRCLVRNATPSWPWIVPVSTCRRRQPTTPCPGSSPGSSSVGLLVPAISACATRGALRQRSRSPRGALVRARRSTSR